MMPFAAMRLRSVQSVVSGSGWNPAGVAAGISLSNSNKTAAQTSGTVFRGGRSLISKASGKWYAEVHIDAIGSGGTSTYFGVVDASASTSPSGPTAIGGQHDVWRENGQTITAGGLGSALSSFVAGDVLMVAIDAGTGKIWFGKNGTFTGSPAAGTGQHSTLTVGTGLYVYFLFDSTNGQIETIRTNASAQSYAAPSGFTSID